MIPKSVQRRSRFKKIILLGWIWSVISLAFCVRYLPLNIGAGDEGLASVYAVTIFLVLSVAFILTGSIWLFLLPARAVLREKDELFEYFFGVASRAGEAQRVVLKVLRTWQDRIEERKQVLARFRERHLDDPTIGSAEGMAERESELAREMGDYCEAFDLAKDWGFDLPSSED